MALSASGIILTSMLAGLVTAQAVMEAAVLMTVYEDEIETSDHTEVVLHCTLKYPEATQEECQQITWTHEINRTTHEEEAVRSCDLYRVNTQLVQHTSHLEILSLSGRVKGWYRCKAECGGHFYTVGCKVGHPLDINSSFLCSMRSFPATTMIITDTSSLYGATGDNKLMLIVTVAAVVVVAILLTTVLRWFIRRRYLRRRRLLALQDITQSLRDTEIAASSRPPGIRLPDDPQLTPCPEVYPGTRSTNNRFQPMSANPVLFQRMPDGSNYVFVPLLSLPSYESALKESSETLVKPNSERNPILIPGLFSIPIGDDSYSSYSSGVSTPLSVSSPPSYRSVESLRLDPRDEDLDNGASSSAHIK
ncbi:uncharacterized protein LOC121382286 [Gigantopelta aegis]|uniref:uncharacterized protein LOC121382286 n=1 Tax=Gigantopelta aegis TaxID=1735272 RepID=UPI001B889F56|nr:uncharacterized protein LOC121382286 [Gigantopelta aegis]